MPHTNSFSVRRTLVVLLAGTGAAAAALGCSSDLVLPDAPAGAENVALTKLAGDTQSGSVGETLAPLIVKVVTETQEPAAGREVVFELTDPAAGSVAPATATTDGEGQAVAEWTLGTVPGSYLATARLAGGSTDEQVAVFTAVAKAGAPDTLTATVPVSQAGRGGQPVKTAPQVRVVDRFGNPVPEASVTWQVIAGGGQVSLTTSTDADGLTSTEWTLGAARGVQKLVASIPDAHGSPVTFTAWSLF